MQDRIFQGTDAQWYYRTVGQHIVGPFSSEDGASEQLNKQIRSWAGRAPRKSRWPRDWHPARFFRRSATRQT